MRNKILLSVVTASALAVLGACGSGSSTSSTPTAATNTPISATANASSADSTTAASAASGASTPASGAGANTGAALQAWEACLSKNGVTLPSTATGARSFPGNGTGSRPTGSFPVNGSNPVGADGSTPVSGGRRNGAGGALATINSFIAEPANSVAAAACKSLKPTFGGAGAGNTANRAAYQAYLSCLASNGVTVPTVDSTETSQPQARQTVDTADPNFATANAKCGVLLPKNTNASGAPQTGAGASSTATTGA